MMYEREVFNEIKVKDCDGQEELIKKDFAYKKEALDNTAYIKELKKEYEQKYVKTMPFERSVYTQCIPNPKRPAEFITVQMVRKRLEYVYG